MDIREIEDIIDILHKNHPAFSGTKEQLMYELLSTFEDKCSIAVMKSMLNPLAVKEITDNMDGLNQALYWVEKSELPNTTSQIVTEISEASQSTLGSFMDKINPVKIAKANAELQKVIHIEDGCLCYKLTNEIIEPFLEI